jgi:Major capsid protein GP7
MAVVKMSATLLEIARRVDKNGKVAQIVEVLNEENEVLQDIPWRECNEGTQHKETIRTGLPEVFFRKYNQGVQSSKSTTAQITDPTCMLEGYSNVDADLVHLNAGQDKGASYRASEDVAFVESMGQKVTRTLFYGTKDASDQFVGFTPRFNDTSAKNAKNIFNGGGVGSTNMSIWFICWGDKSAFGLYPKGAQGGIVHNNIGERQVMDSNGGEFTAFTSKFGWKPGLTVKDWRYVSRIANVDVTDLANVDLITLMTKAANIIPRNRGGLKCAWYVREEVYTALELQAKNKANVHLTIEDLEKGGTIMKFKGYPIRQVDQLLATEEAVTFPA